MGSPLSATATATAFPRFSYSSSTLIGRCIHTRLFAQGPLVRPISSLSYSSRLISLRPASVPKLLHRRFECAASSTTSTGADGLSTDVIILNVEGMSCGGCVSSVKKILESQPQVSSATVDLTTETAVVCPISEAKVLPNWQKDLGDALAKHLTTCGFKSTLRVAGDGASQGDASS